jgi:hypothetical protein
MPPGRSIPIHHWTEINAPLVPPRCVFALKTYKCADRPRGRPFVSHLLVQARSNVITVVDIQSCHDISSARCPGAIVVPEHSQTAEGGEEIGPIRIITGSLRSR